VEEPETSASKKGGELSQLDLAIVLAAGEGTRMKSARAKVLHEIAGRSLIAHVLHSINQLDAKEVRVVVGAAKEEVIAHLGELAPKVKTVFQEVRGGTGHATRIALENSADTGTVLICAGDTPLLTARTLSALVAQHNSSAASATVLTTQMPDPTGYGRVIRDSNGDLAEIVEEKDANDYQKQTLEINSGVYVFSLADLKVALTKLTANNSQKEEYLTDVISILRKESKKVSAFATADYTEIMGINDRAQLSTCGFLMNARICDALMKSGVTIVDPMSTWIDVTAEIGVDVHIEPGTAIKGTTKIGQSAIVGPRTTLINTEVGSQAKVFESHCESAFIGDGAQVGPFTHLRAGTVGEHTNIGAATVVVNYDGVEKHQTVIGDHVRIGSDSMLVAPVTIGDGAYTAAGSVITEDVPAGALGMARSKQSNILGWVLKKRQGTKSAEAAAKREGQK
jgi:bifunctional UDP-N-acetylglucosamine pyrophosphorylase/glucosamine-1-phosphate N-acetyltransferase